MFRTATGTFKDDVRAIAFGQILNRRDDCCFGERQHDARRAEMAYEPAYRVYEKAVQSAVRGAGEFRLEIDESAPRHMISPWAVGRILAGIK